MALANECIPFYEPGQRVTGRAKSAITGKRCVDVSGDREDGLIGIAHATADGKILGVASHDAADGENVTVITGGIVPITATNATIAAAAEVEVDTGGKVKVLDAGKAIGICVTACAANGDAQIHLY